MIYDGSIKSADYAEEAAELAVEKLLNSAGGYENAMKAEALRILQAKTMNEILHPKTPVVPVVVPGSTGVQVVETVPVDPAVAVIAPLNPAVIVDPTEGEIAVVVKDTPTANDPGVGAGILAGKYAGTADAEGNPAFKIIENPAIDNSPVPTAKAGTAAAEEPATVVVPESVVTVDTQNGNTIVTDTQSKTTVVL